MPRTNSASAQRTTQRRVVIGVVVAALLAVGVTGLTGATAGAQTTPPPEITVTFIPRPSAPGFPACDPWPPFGAVTPYIGNTTTEYTITINVNKRLCAPVGATAASYRYPSAAQRSPQTLVRRQTLTLQESGDYVVRYAKGSQPRQFYLLSGTTPDLSPPTIAFPGGPLPGPQLFLFDQRTTLQWDGTGPEPVIPEFPAPALGLAAAAVVAGGALWWRRRRSVVPAT